MLPTSRSARLMMGFGLFLFLCGFAGWAAAGFTAKARTAILSGSVTGLAMIAMGCLAGSSSRLASVGRKGGLVLPVLFTGVFSWRAAVAWQAHAAGQPKLYVAILLSVMAAASLAVFAALNLRIIEGNSGSGDPHR